MCESEGKCFGGWERGTKEINFSQCLNFKPRHAPHSVTERCKFRQTNDERRENYRKILSFCFSGADGRGKQKGDGLQAIVIQSLFATVLSSLDSALC